MRDNQLRAQLGAGRFGLLLKEISDSRIERNSFTGNSVGLSAEGTKRSRGRKRFRTQRVGGTGDGRRVETGFRDNRFSGTRFDVGPTASTRRPVLRKLLGPVFGYDLDSDGPATYPSPRCGLFGLVVQQHPPALILLNSFFTRLLDLAERALPVVDTPGDSRQSAEDGVDAGGSAMTSPAVEAVGLSKRSELARS
jgi:nitrous oxidase accessory protein